MTKSLQSAVESKIPKGYELIFSMPVETTRPQTMKEVIDRIEKGPNPYKQATDALEAHEGKDVFVLGIGKGYSPEGVAGRLSSLNWLTSGTYFSIGENHVELFGLIALAVKQ